MNFVHYGFKMRLGANNFKYFPDNKLTKLANLLQFKRMFMFLSGVSALGHLPPPLVYATGHAVTPEISLIQLADVVCLCAGNSLLEKPSLFRAA